MATDRRDGNLGMVVQLGITCLDTLDSEATEQSGFTAPLDRLAPHPGLAAE